MKRGELIWAGAVFLCLAWLALYSGRSGRPAEAPFCWPGGLERGARSTLLVFAHPKCPCTRATLSQVEGLARHSPVGARLYLVFLQPGDVEPDFHRTGLWWRAQEMPGVTVVRDDGGRLARRFGVYTSGQALLYDAAGHLVFAGGLTPARGHEGPSMGMDAVRSAFRGSHPAGNVPVYGCSLQSEGEEFCRP
jgi:hypothetical protein